jgi:hypothetical protein
VVVVELVDDDGEAVVDGTVNAGSGTENGTVSLDDGGGIVPIGAVSGVGVVVVVGGSVVVVVGSGSVGIWAYVVTAPPRGRRPGGAAPWR